MKNKKIKTKFLARIVKILQKNSLKIVSALALISIGGAIGFLMNGITGTTFGAALGYVTNEIIQS